MPMISNDIHAVAQRLNRPIQRGELRADCPLCGKGSKSSTKLRISHGRAGGLFAYCYSCNAPSRDILRALGVEPPSTGYTPPPAAYQPPEPVGAPTAAPLPPLSPSAVRVYMAAIATPGRTGRIEYGSTDGRQGTHERTALPPSLPGGKPGKDIRMWGLRGHGWYPRKWLPAGGPTLELPRFLTEGEKDAGIIAQLGYEAYSAPGGAGRFRSLALEPVISDSLADGAPLVIIQDNDAAGYRWGAAVHAKLRAAGVTVVRPSPAAEDVGDSLADNRELLLELAETLHTKKLADFAMGGGVGKRHFYLDTPIAKSANFLSKAEIARPERPDYLRCKAGYARRGTAAADVGAGGGGRTLTMPVDCRKCERCLEWQRIERWAQWEAGAPSCGEQARLDFLDMDYAAMRKALRSQQQRCGCRGEPAFHVTVRRELPAEDEDSSPEYRYDVLVWYRDGLSEKGVKNTRAWAARQGIQCEIERGLTVTKADFDGVLTGRTIRGEDGRRTYTSGFWSWPVKFEPPPEPAHILGRDAHRVHIPGERGAVAPVGSEAAMKRLEVVRRDRELGAALNARDFMAPVAIPRLTWERMRELADDGSPLPNLPGYKGPPGLIREAVLASLYRRPMRDCYLAVLARVGADPGSVLELPRRERMPLTDIADGLRQLKRRLDASELAGGAVALIEPPASEAIEANDYASWEDWDVAMPYWENSEPEGELEIYEDWRTL